MKIGIYDPYLNTLGGGEKYILTAAGCLAKKHHVTIFWDVDNAEEIREKILDRFALDLSGVAFAENIFSKKTSFLARLRRSSQFDYILFLSDGSIPFTRCNLLLHFQSPLEWVRENSLKTKVKLLKTKQIICNSQFTKKYIDKKFRVDSSIIYPPVTLRKNEKVEKENIILNVGRFGIKNAGSSYKKQEVLIDVFKQMVDEGLREWKFILVVSVIGDIHEKLEALKQSAKGYPIDIVVNPKGRELWHAYWKAKIYWHAAGFGEDLEKHPDRAEHFGISTAEAMGAGAVPVVIKAGGQIEIVTDGLSGYLWKTTDELKERTVQLIKDPELLSKVSSEAKKAVSVFSVENFCRQIQGLIQ